jgi:hypothetical protein
MLRSSQSKLQIGIILGFLILVILSTGIPVAAAPVLQLTPFLTPTPGPDGRIIYIVQPNDTLLRISLIAGISIDEIRGLNNLVGDSITVGQELLLGLGGPSQLNPTAGPSPTPTEVIPTPTTLPGKGVLCVLLYNDRNGDSVRQEDEPSIPGGAISISNLSGSVAQTAKTGEGLEYTCYQDLPEGQYNISVAIPDGYNPTTVGNYVLKLNAGDETYLNFGAQENTKTQAEAPTPTGSGKSPILGIVGGLLLLSGIGLGVFARRLLKGR